MPLNYWKEDADDGTDTAAAVQPIENGEPVEEAYLNRAPENLRGRTEDIRGLLDDLQATNRSDRAFAVFAKSDAKVVLDDTGTGEYRFTVNDAGTPGTSNRDLLITPMLSPSKVSATTAVPARFYYDEDSTNGLALSLDNVSGHPRKVAEGSHNIYLQLLKDATVTGAPVVEIKADNPAAPNPLNGPVYVIVHIKSGDTTTLTEIDAAIDASPAGALVTASVVGTGTTVVTLSTANSWGPFRAYETDEGDSAAGTPYGARAGVDDEGYLIQASAFNALFATRVMKDGDTLFLNFLDAKTRTGHTTGTIFTDASSLEIVSSDERLGTDTRNLGDADGPIPLFKVTVAPGSGGVATLVCLNQRSYVLDVPGYVMTSSAAVDDTRVDLAKQTGTPNGDYMVGAEAKSGSPNSLAQGTANSQMAELLADGNDLIADLASQTGTVGASLVGNDALVGIVYNQPAGPLSTQLGNIFADADTLQRSYDEHIAGTSQKHALDDIVGVLHYTVDTSRATGGNNFATLTEAFTNAATYGGTYVIKAGTYEVSATVTPSKRAIFVGETLSGGVSAAAGANTLIKFASANPILITAAGDQAGLWTFKHMLFNFYGYQAKGFTFGSNTDEGTDGGFRFENCMFVDNYNRNGEDLITSYANLTFDHCNFVGHAYDSNNGGICVGTISGKPVTRLTARNCAFTRTKQIICASLAGDDPAMNLEFVGNTVADCGYATATASTPVIYTGAASALVNISDNVWEEYVSNAAATGVFCSVRGSGRVENNLILNALAVSPTVAMPRIRAISASAEDKLIIAGNRILAGQGNAIEATGALVVGNIILGWNPNFTTAAAILVGQGTEVVNNRIVCAAFTHSPTAPRVIEIGNGAQHVAIHGNYISGGGSDDLTLIYGYHTSGTPSDFQITGNTASSITAGDAVNIGGTTGTIKRVIVSGNMFSNISSSATVGISLAICAQFVITHNVLFMGANSTYGIFSASSDGTVVSNQVYRSASGGTNGILLSGANICITGNSVHSNWASQISAAADGGVGPLENAWPGNGSNYGYQNWNYSDGAWA